jgi:subtilisin
MRCVFSWKAYAPFMVGVVLLTASILPAQTRPRDDRQAVIISFRQHPSDGDAALLQFMGGHVKRRFNRIPAMAARLPQPVIEWLRNNPAVASIDPDLEVHALDEYSSAWGVSRIGSRVVHDAGNKGGAVKVCIIDSGVDRTHPDLAGRYAGGYDFVNDDADPTDDNGHGTHVAGTIAAILNGAGVVGVAPEAQILAYKILDSTGSGSFSDAIAAVEACQAAGGKVTNNSYGSSGNPGTAVQQAFDLAYSAGVLHVASAGNSGSGTDTVGYPAKFDSVIAVAATDQNNARASFSSTGPKVELSAPGVSILSTYLNGGYAYASGTSMASPHVAGLAALVFNCGLSPSTNAAVRSRLQQTAQDLGTAGRDPSYGFGLVQANLAAMNCASTPPPPAAIAAPTNLVAANTGTRRVSLTWKDNATNESKYILERCLVSGSTCNYSLRATLGVNARSFTDSSVSRRTAYRYRVKAANSTAESAYAVSNTITTN